MVISASASPRRSSTSRQMSKRLDVYLQRLVRLSQIGATRPGIVHRRGLAATAPVSRQMGNAWSKYSRAFCALAQVGIGPADIVERQRLAVAAPTSRQTGNAWL